MTTKEKINYKIPPLKKNDWEKLVKEFEKDTEKPIAEAKFPVFCSWLARKGYAYKVEGQAR